MDNKLKDIANGYIKLAEYYDNQTALPASLSKPIAEYYRQIAKQIEGIKTEADYNKAIKELGKLENFNNELVHKLKELGKEDK